MAKNNIVRKTSQIISSPFFQFVVQTAIALSGNPEIMRFSNSLGIIQTEFANFIKILLDDISNNNDIDYSKINSREIYYFVTKTLKEVYFENSIEKRNLFRNLILSSLKSAKFESDLNKDYLITLTQINEKEILIMKQVMINKSDKNGFKNEFDYWEIYKEFENLNCFSKDDYQSYVNHLIGLGLLNHSQSSLWGGDKSIYSITSKGVGFFTYIKLGN